ncbi:hypothetical protein QCA50_013493 [Cerrena zonata]|uniref:Uncharacterized protein n=1 Tax=Cerrena zonata TaxID=2478898 RepID=A0AAW0FQU1_9APHY
MSQRPILNDPHILAYLVVEVHGESSFKRDYQCKIWYIYDETLPTSMWKESISNTVSSKPSNFDRFDRKEFRNYHLPITHLLLSPAILISHALVLIVLLLFPSHKPVM